MNAMAILPFRLVVKFNRQIFILASNSVFTLAIHGQRGNSLKFTPKTSLIKLNFRMTKDDLINTGE